MAPLAGQLHRILSALRHHLSLGTVQLATGQLTNDEATEAEALGIRGILIGQAGGIEDDFPLLAVRHAIKVGTKLALGFEGFGGGFEAIHHAVVFFDLGQVRLAQAILGPGEDFVSISGHGLDLGMDGIQRAGIHGEDGEGECQDWQDDQRFLFHVIRVFVLSVCGVCGDCRTAHLSHQQPGGCQTRHGLVVWGLRVVMLRPPLQSFGSVSKPALHGFCRRHVSLGIQPALQVGWLLPSAGLVGIDDDLVDALQCGCSAQMVSSIPHRDRAGPVNHHHRIAADHDLIAGHRNHRSNRSRQRIDLDRNLAVILPSLPCHQCVVNPHALKDIATR